MRIAIDTHGTYLSVQNGTATFSTKTIGPNEVFMVHPLTDAGWIALEAVDGQFLAIPRPSLIGTFILVDRPDTATLPITSIAAISEQTLFDLYGVTTVA